MDLARRLLEPLGANAAAGIKSIGELQAYVPFDALSVVKVGGESTKNAQFSCMYPFHHNRVFKMPQAANIPAVDGIAAVRLPLRTEDAQRIIDGNFAGEDMQTLRTLAKKIAFAETALNAGSLEQFKAAAISSEAATRVRRTRLADAEKSRDGVAEAVKAAEITFHSLSKSFTTHYGDGGEPHPDDELFKAGAAWKKARDALGAAEEKVAGLMAEIESAEATTAAATKFAEEIEAGTPIMDRSAYEIFFAVWWFAIVSGIVTFADTLEAARASSAEGKPTPLSNYLTVRAALATGRPIAIKELNGFQMWAPVLGAGMDAEVAASVEAADAAYEAALATESEPAPEAAPATTIAALEAKVAALKARLAELRAESLSNSAWHDGSQTADS